MPIALGVLLVAVLALGFMSMQAMLQRLTQVEDNSSFWSSVLSPLTVPLRLVNRGQKFVWDQMVAILSRFAGASIHALAHWFFSLEALAADTARAVASFSETMGDAIEHMVVVTIPHAIRDAVRHEGRLRQIADDQLRRYARGIDRLVRDHVLPHVRALERTVTVTIPREFQRAWARDRAIAARIPHALGHRLSRVERLTTFAAIGAVVVRVLARRFPWLFCRKTSMLGRRLCGLDGDLMESLLADTLLIAGLISIEEFARSVQGITGLMEDGLRGFIREL